MQNVELLSFSTDHELARGAAGAWLEEIEAANRAGKSHFVALSGGRIAQKFFATAVELSKARAISLSGVHFFWADERCVPPTDPESNFALADQFLFRPLDIAAANIHRIRGELPPEKAAELAAAEVQCVVPTTSSSPSPPPREERAGERRRAALNSNPLTPTLSPLGRGEGVDDQPLLDMLFLGMGEDGHVASLFPGEPEAIRRSAAIYRAVVAPKPPPRRITLGYATIAAARQVWVLASGSGKEPALRESLSPDGQTPLANVLKLRPKTKIFTDLRPG